MTHPHSSTVWNYGDALSYYTSCSGDALWSHGHEAWVTSSGIPTYPLYLSTFLCLSRTWYPILHQFQTYERAWIMGVFYIIQWNSLIESWRTQMFAMNYINCACLWSKLRGFPQFKPSKAQETQELFKLPKNSRSIAPTPKSKGESCIRPRI